MTKKEDKNIAKEQIKKDLDDVQTESAEKIQNDEGQKQEAEQEDKKSEKTVNKSDTKKKSSRNKSTKTEKKKTVSEDQFKQAEEKAKEWQDKYMRLSAEFDNYRKRTLKEKAELTKTANADLLAGILPVVDDFERGIDNLEKAENLEAMKEGINLIYNKFKEFIKQNGIKEIEALEKEFDLDYHEALTKIPAPSDDLKGKVVDVIEKGYILNEKIIRYAKVVVGE